MDEEEDKKKEPDKPTEDINEGSKHETTPIIKRAREEREKLEAANKKKEELLEREEELMAKRELGGESEAGIQPPKKEKLTDSEIADKVLKGEINPLKEDGFI